MAAAFVDYFDATRVIFFLQIQKHILHHQFVISQFNLNSHLHVACNNYLTYGNMSLHTMKDHSDFRLLSSRMVFVVVTTFFWTPVMAKSWERSAHLKITGKCNSTLKYLDPENIIVYFAGASCCNYFACCC